MERKLVQVERGNVVLQVPEYDVQRFLDQGYNLIDDSGNIIQASVPRDLGTLQKLYVEQSQEIERLKEEIQKLKTAKPASKTTTGKSTRSKK